MRITGAYSLNAVIKTYMSLYYPVETVCSRSGYHRTFIPLSVSLWTDLSNAEFDGVELAGFKSTGNAFKLA